jgi:hypothetical protein
VSTPKNRKDTRAGQSTGHRPKRKKGNLIRLDDLIPKQNVVGGRMFFGASKPTQPKHNQKEES